MFNRFFGTNQTKKKAPAPSLNDSIQQLRGAVTTLEKREVHLEKKIQLCVDSAKAKSKRRDKKGALFELKKKKQLENQLQSIQAKKLNLETQIMTLEDAHLNKETLKAMKTSKNAIQSTIKDTDVDKADELMEDLNEAMEAVNEVNEAMSQPLGQPLDDDELEAELAELEEMEADELLNDMPVNNKAAHKQKDDSVDLDMPSVPAQKIKPKTQEAEQDDELAELEAMMN